MPESLSANQLVAYNLMRIRKTRGLSQEETAEKLEPYLGARWSKAVYSAAERSYDGKRVRQFSANDLLAMAAAFGVPITYFFLPPRPENREPGAALRSGDAEVSWRALFDLMFDGPYSAAMFHRALELPPDERPEADSRAGLALGHLSIGRTVDLPLPPDRWAVHASATDAGLAWRRAQAEGSQTEGDGSS